MSKTYNYHIDTIKEHIMIADGLNPHLIDVDECQDQENENIKKLIEDMRTAVFKLQSTISESNDNNYSLGFEMGQQRAAELIENIIKKYNF